MGLKTSGCLKEQFDLAVTNKSYDQMRLVAEQAISILSIAERKAIGLQARIDELEMQLEPAPDFAFWGDEGIK